MTTADYIYAQNRLAMWQNCVTDSDMTRIVINDWGNKILKGLFIGAFNNADGTVNSIKYDMAMKGADHFFNMADEI